jgi:hypothetical protein
MGREDLFWRAYSGSPPSSLISPRAWRSARTDLPWCGRPRPSLQCPSLASFAVPDRHRARILSRLLALRRAIFGLGAAQLVLTAAALASLAYALGLTGWRGAVIGGFALAMSATAIALKVLEERGQLQQPHGQRAFAILPFQDMSVVPLLAPLLLLAPGVDTHVAEFGDTLIAVGRSGRSWA